MLEFLRRRPFTDLFRSVLGYAVVPNLVLGLIASYFGVGRPLINLDYLGIAVLAPWLPRWLLRLGLGFAVLLDLLQTVAPTYQFNIGKILETTQDLFNLSPAFAVPIAIGVLALSGGLAWLMTRLAPAHRWQTLHGLLLGVAALGADVALSPNALTGMERAVTQLNVAGSPGLFFLIEARSALTGAQHVVISAAPERASQPIVDALSADAPLPRHLVLVLIESWGLYTDDQANALIYAPLRALAQQRGDLELRTGAVAFLGSTVNGELRELCGLRSNSIRLPNPAIPLDGCLPHALSVRGYASTAIHGYRGSMFNRNNWYPQAGFARSLFDRELSQVLGRESRCGATFPGACDGDVPKMIGQQLDEAGTSAQFVYWLTLNAHLPIYATDDPRARLDCSISSITASDEQQCRLVKLHRLVMQSLADLMAHRQDTALIVVGDHAPAFVSGQRRHSLSGTQVPSAVLWPRTAISAPPSNPPPR